MSYRFWFSTVNCIIYEEVFSVGISLFSSFGGGFGTSSLRFATCSWVCLRNNEYVSNSCYLVNSYF